MSISDELQKLDGLRRNGVLSDDEFELAKRQVLEEARSAHDSESVHVIKTQNELAQLDREWLLKREGYMMEGADGERFIPGKADSVIQGLLAVCLGAVFTGIAYSAGGFRSASLSSLFGLGGILFCLLGVGFCVIGFVKAGRHAAAERRYRLRRQQLLNRIRNSSMQ